MDALLKRQTSIEISIQGSQLLQLATAFRIDWIKRRSSPPTQEPDLDCCTKITNYLEMASFSTLDDMRTIRLKVDQKAHDLFKEKPGQAPLTVTRIFKSKERNASSFEKEIKVLNLSDVNKFRDVRNPPNYGPVFLLRHNCEVMQARIS
jgi:hypothetical protein